MIVICCIVLAIVALAIWKAIWFVAVIAALAFLFMTFFELKHNGIAKYIKGAARAATKETLKKNPDAIFNGEEIDYRDRLKSLRAALEAQLVTIKSLESQSKKETAEAQQLRKDVIKLNAADPNSDLAKSKAIAVLTKEKLVAKLNSLAEDHRAKYKTILAQTELFESDMENRLASMKANAALAKTLNAERAALSPLCDKSQEWTVADSEDMLDDAINGAEAGVEFMQLPSSEYDPDEALAEVLNGSK
jgi:hypothetical protein